MQIVNPTTLVPYVQQAVTHTTSGLVMSDNWQANCHTLTGTITVKAPPNPQDAQCFSVADVDADAGANHITVNGNGKNIDGSATATISTNSARQDYVYDGAQWRAVKATLRKYDGEGGTMPDRSGPATLP